MFLTDEQVVELTGRTRPTAQIRWLKERGYPFELNADDKPKLLTTVVESRLGGRISPEPKLRLAS